MLVPGEQGVMEDGKTQERRADTAMLMDRISGVFCCLAKLNLDAEREQRIDEVIKLAYEDENEVLAIALRKLYESLYDSLLVWVVEGMLERHPTPIQTRHFSRKLRAARRFIEASETTSPVATSALGNSEVEAGQSSVWLRLYGLRLFGWRLFDLFLLVLVVDWMRPQTIDAMRSQPVPLDWLGEEAEM